MTFRKIITKYFYYFYSRVNCALAPRELEKNEFTDYLQVKYFDFKTNPHFPKQIFFSSQNEFSTGAYTHHQKSIIVDAPNPYGGLRRLMAFVGGLDLTGGRWDTPGMREKPNVIAFLIVFLRKKLSVP